MVKRCRLGSRVLGAHLLVAVCLPLQAAAPSPARACSGSPCWPHRYLPFEGTVPANLPGFELWPGFDWTDDAGEFDGSDPDALRLRCSSGLGAEHDVAFHVEGDAPPFWLVPDATLQAGDRCELTTDANACAIGGALLGFSDLFIPGLSGRAEITITDAAALPTELGVLRADASRLRTVTTSHGSLCTEARQVCGVQLTVELSDAAQPWSHTFVYETRVDDEPWRPAAAANLPNVPGGSFVGRGVDLVFIDAERVNRVERGAHTVLMRARVAGTDVVLQTPAITVQLECEDSADSDAGGVEPEADAGSEPRDAGAAPRQDSGVVVSDGASDDEATTCTCRTLGARRTRSRTAAPLWLLAGTLLALWVRARSPRRRGPG